MRHLPFTAATLPLVLTAACGDAAPSVRAIVRDSAGVAIVENPALPAADTAAWQIVAEPVLQVGVVDGEEAYQFGSISGVTRLSDGTIAVADGGSSQIRFFDASGLHLRSLGREGDGPGEFRYVSALLMRPADSLIVVSGNSGTAYSVIPPGADVATPFAFVMGFYYPFAMLADGRTLHLRYANSIPYDAVGLVQDSIYIVVQDLPSALGQPAATGVSGAGVSAAVQLNPAAISADTIVRIAGNAEFRRRFGNGISNSGVVWGRRVESAIQGDSVLIGVGSDGIVQVYAADGRLVRSIRFTAAREPLESAEIESWKEWNRALARNEVQRTGIEAFIEAIDPPADRPSFGGVLVDRTGWIWLQRYEVDSGYRERMSDAPRRWYILDPEGRAAAALDVPADFRVEEIGADYILGVGIDADGVETVRMYGLRRGDD